ncbi:MAG: putative metal-binding motif-containing protein [Deltaproteobacteria bacterium]|nr:putative metal-binding motif-containing protein [Deltaproteobacteria bacterium]
MSRKNGAWGLDAMAMVAAHETAHVFHALDEYSQEGYATCECGGQSLQTGTWEYNGCKNDNCRLPSGYYCKTPHDICLMSEEQEEAWYDHHLCWSTTCHIGWVCKPESCDWIDNDCDGLTDEDAGAAGCEWHWKDADGDWFGGSASDKKCLCSPQGDYRAKKTGDCDDSNAAANPGAKEKCDGIDNDCDGKTDPDGSIGCDEGHPDADGDGYGAAAGTACTCGGTSKQGGDCDDSNAEVNPKALETCNGFDDDCDGKVDPKYSVGCVDTYQDADGDGYGGGKMSCLCLAPGQEPLTRGGDCADSDPAVHPGAEEVCNGIDDDCEGGIDEDLPGCETSQPDAAGPEETPEETPEEEAPGPEYDEDAIAGPEAEEEPVPSGDPDAQPNKGGGGCGAGAPGAFPVALAASLLSLLAAVSRARRASRAS